MSASKEKKINRDQSLCNRKKKKRNKKRSDFND